MIRITQQDSAKDAKRYYATADYYSEVQELVGSWVGIGASMLGLAGRWINSPSCAYATIATLYTRYTSEAASPGDAAGDGYPETVKNHLNG